ncbi:MAG: RagB/SusD family nutrient uptake outer membrane protein [Ferruginibacter sp.]|nr:RagB/SusD family nutrient uptake outer membrane protein [Ferruginibacter sp.]
MKANYILFFLCSSLIVLQISLLCSCKKFIDIGDPKDQLNSSLVFTDSSTAVTAINGIYAEMFTNRNLFSNSATTIYAGMSADELYPYAPSLKDEFFKNELSPANHINIDINFWKPAYKFIYMANLALEKLADSKELTSSLKLQLSSEAKLIRAFCYFNLVNLFGEVPLITESKYQVAAIAPRAPISKIYSQMIMDLTEAKAGLSATYLSGERVRPNKWTAAALLARCYLYQGNWTDAEAEASSVINDGTYQLEADLNKVFLKGSPETIWQLKPVRPGFNTYEGIEFVPSTALTIPTYLATTGLLNAFEATDNRKTAWLKSRVFNGSTLYFPYKYKIASSTVLTEYLVMFRLAEIYLTQAEACAQQNKVSQAKIAINKIRNRAGLANISAADKASLLLAVEQERRIELFAEWGHRWFDLKRTGRADALLGPLKGITWQPTDQLWPVPQPERNLNPLLTQNPGY